LSLIYNDNRNHYLKRRLQYSRLVAHKSWPVIRFARAREDLGITGHRFGIGVVWPDES
jgi:hypothetical protein